MEKVLTQRLLIVWIGFWLLSVLTLAMAYVFLHQSLPQLDGKTKLNQLTGEVRVLTDSHGIPNITAAHREDAVLALGYVTARDRLFQMELMRRKNAGRLAELFGEKALDSDIKARTYGFNRQAKALWAKLNPKHRRYLELYAEGVNRFMADANRLPFEFKVLGYRPEAWSASDSILVILGMCENLTAWTERSERMLSVMEKTLPEDFVRFLTPDTDLYTDQLLKQAESWRPMQPIPIDSMADVLKHRSDEKTAQVTEPSDFLAGSNAWAVSGQKSWDGRAILANDMHLGLSVPNIWYRIELNYGDVRAAGVNLPGTPLLIAGSNGLIAWGATNLSGDFLDLVKLEIDPSDPNQYRQGDHWRRFDELSETILIKGGESRKITVRHTLWGPVATQPLLGQPVAIHWTALDLDAMNLDMFDLEQSQTLDQAIKIVNHSGGPQLNVLLADDKGHIGWTLMGRIPKRFGNDGLASRSWADGRVGWEGYVRPEDLPRVIDPPEGFLISANDRRLGKDYPYVIGHQFGNGHRAYRIHQRLSQLPKVDEWALFNLQLDSQSDFYVFYQHLALSVLKPELLEKQADWIQVRDYLRAWNGRADVDSLGFALLVEFRKQLIEATFTPFLSAAKQLDPSFNYGWTYIDMPLQALLKEKPVKLLPDVQHYPDWDEFILGQLKLSVDSLRARHPGVDWMDLNWGRQNKVNFQHPFSKALPFLGALLDMPSDALPGCPNCVRATGPDFGASERLVVAPSHLEEAILHIPGGQSGQALSPYYNDQQQYWLKGLAMPLLAGKPEHVFLLEPDRAK